MASCKQHNVKKHRDKDNDDNYNDNDNFNNDYDDDIIFHTDILLEGPSSSLVIMLLRLCLSFVIYLFFCD